MNITITLPGLRNIVKKNAVILLWAFLVLVIIIEGFVIKGVVGMVLKVKNAPIPFQTQVVRVNLSQYEKIEKRVLDSSLYEPSFPTNLSPFGIAPKDD